MGAKESRQFPLTYDEALKRVTEAERRRIQDAFRRLSGPSGYVGRQVFVKDVLGDGVPSSVADRIFCLCGGGPGTAPGSSASSGSGFSVGTQNKGLSFRDTLTVLVLLTRGTSEEKTKFIFGLLAGDNDSFIERNNVEKQVREWEHGYLPPQLASLFIEGNRVTYEHFVDWLESNSDCLGLTRWMLAPNSTLSLNNKFDTPTFYQTLAGVTHLEEQEIVELEKKFWTLSANSNQIDINVIQPLVSPPLPPTLVQPLFDAFDENQDGHIDFKELCCGVSAACRGPDVERLRFCFKVFDTDRDGFLSRSEVEVMIQSMINVQLSTKTNNQTVLKSENHSSNSKSMYDNPAFTNSTVDCRDKSNDESNKSIDTTEAEIQAEVDRLMMDPDEKGIQKDFVSIQDYLVWTVTSELPKSFARLLFQVCHIVLGLRPQSRRDEGEIVRGWLDREEKTPLTTGSIWYVINMDWWSQWQAYVNEDVQTPGERPRRPQGSDSSSLSSLSNGDDSYRRSGSLNSTTSTPCPSPKPPKKNFTPIRPGLIENTNLVQVLPYKVPTLTGEGGKLKTSVKLFQGRDFELLPERLWKALQQWYGGSLPLPRQVIRNANGDLELELNPLSIKLLKHQSIPRPTHVPTVVGGYSAAALHVTGAAYPTAQTSTTMRRYHAYQATFSKRTTVGQIQDFLSTRLRINHEDLRLWFFRDETNMRLLENDLVTLEDAGFRDEDSLLVEARSRDGTWPEEISSLVIGDRRGSVISVTPPSVPGMIGLNNLGNTCYMNAALQCVANTKILAKYFNNNCHLFELNRSNPLGMKGHIAKRFGDLVREMWAPNCKAIAPIKLRWTIGRYSSNFAGFQQQDSQELLAFLLDGLHEDLNRVTEKPYSELEDSDGRPDLIVAQEAWENHVLRNKSVIVDLFHGQLKSKVTCKVCSHESVRFDPFTYLSLPLPMESSVRIEIVVIRQDGSTPVKYGLTMDMESKYSELKPAVSQLCKIPSQNIILVDIVHAQFVLPSTDDQKLKGLNGACIFAYEFQPLDVPVQKPTRQTNLESMADIQRSTISRPPSAKSEDQCPIVDQVNGGRDPKGVMMSKNGSEVSPSWPAQICMTGISLCFKPGNLSNSSKPRSTHNKPSSETRDLPVESQNSPKEIPLLSESKAVVANAVVSNGGIVPNGSLVSQNSHSRQSSLTSTHSSESGKTSLGYSNAPGPGDDLGDCHLGIIVALHRKVMPQEVYFLSTEKYRPTLFGLPLIVACSEGTTHLDLYKSVWTQVSRLVSPLPPRDSSQNHATDCDDSLGYEYPFVLKVVQKGGSWCAWCPWHRFCRGCSLPCSGKEFGFGSSYLAIDWDQTALHLRYLANQEKAFIDDSSVAESLKSATEPITLVKCLEAFTREEELGENEKYYCSSCKNHQLASKKLQIWRLPPILIVHLKRFHQLNGRWIKSHKIVDFPFHNLDPTNYLASVPQMTLTRFKELKLLRPTLKSNNSFVDCNGTISESNENEAKAELEDGSTVQTELSLDEGLTTSIPNQCVVTGNGPIPETKDESRVEKLLREESVESDIFEEMPTDMTTRKYVDENLRSFRLPLGRNRQVSTSLQTHPILDDNLQDFHQHKLLPGKHPLDINYNMYAMVCHSGVLGGGHYVSYAKSSTGQWFCQNDSSCKEIKEDQIDKSMAYMLFYEREGLCFDQYLPVIDADWKTPDIKDLDDDLDDFKKQCTLM